MKERIKEYLKIKMISKYMMIKEIKRIDEVVQTLAQAQAEQNILIEEFKKTSYKEKYKNEHKKLKDLEKESKEIIAELTETLKKLEKGEK